MVSLTNFEIIRATLSGESETSRQEFISVISELMGTKELPFSVSLRAQADRLKQQVRDPHMNVGALLLLSAEFKKNMLNELTQYLFFVIPSERNWLYLEPEKWFGRAPLDHFQGIERDVRDACQCFALAQWTATVFHSMRILELGLREFAGRIGVTMKTPTDLADWKAIIDAANKHIGSERQKPKTQARSDELDFFSKIMLQFGYFKDAWRNHVSHARESYDEQEASRVLSSVRDFMAQIAGGAP